MVDGRTEGEMAITMPSDFNWSMACSHWQIQHLQQQCLEQWPLYIPEVLICRTQNRSLSVLEHFNCRDQRTEKFPSPLYLPPPPSHTGPSILSMAISERDPHNPTDVEVLDFYYPLTKTSDLVVFDLTSELPLSIWSDFFIATSSERLNC